MLAGGLLQRTACCRALSGIAQALEDHLRSWAQLAGQHGLVCLELLGRAEGLPPACLSPVLQAWRSARGLPQVSLPALLRAAAAVGLMPRQGSELCIFARYGVLPPCCVRPAARAGTP